MRTPRLLVGITVAILLLAGPALQHTAAQDAATITEELAPIGRWRVTSSMNERREYAGGVRLNDGRILAVSGHPMAGKAIASAEVYNARDEKWTNTGSLRQARHSGNPATLLRDGRVLLVGGHNKEVIRDGELYDPKTGKWEDAGMLSIGRDPVATVLADGRVLVAGGIDWYTDAGKIHRLAELFDPDTRKWVATGELRNARYSHRSVLLDDGRVLAVGGYSERDALLASAEIYDPSTGVWQTTDGLSSPRVWFGLVKLRDGRILVTGGYTGTSSNRKYLASAMIYDSKTELWSDVHPMRAKRAGFAITLLPDGQVLVCGGVAESGVELTSAELFDPQSETWLAVAPMNVRRRNHRAALLPDGSVLVMGGGTT